MIPSLSVNNLLSRASSSHKFIQQLLTIVVGMVVLAISAHLIIPLQPVPVTLQSATVLLMGFICGPKRGIAVVAAYIFAGACGLPMFASPVLWGATAGYLIGFLPAILLVGYLSQRTWANSFIARLVIAALGTTLIFACGITFLAASILSLIHI